MSDILIDDIARAMTEVEAPANLGARVLSEISRPRSQRWPTVLLPLAAAASIVAVGALAMRPVITEFEVPAVSRPSLVQLATVDPAPRIVGTNVIASPAPRAAASISADELAWLSRRLPALETRALALDPIQPVTPSIAPINVEPIALALVSVPPLVLGSGSGDRQ